MARGDWRGVVQRLIGSTGYQLRRIEKGVSIDDPYEMQRTLLGPGIRTIFEVGAADGADTENYAETYPEATIYAFEPVKENFAEIKERAKRIPRLVPVEMALSDRIGESTFYIAESNVSSSLLPPKETGSRFDELQKTRAEERVQTTTLDAFCSERDIGEIDLLKIDAQGAELSILNGGAGMFDRGGISLVFLEVQFLPSYEGASRYDELATFLYSKGFELHNLYDLHHNQRGQLCWGDALFVRPSRRS